MRIMDMKKIEPDFCLIPKRVAKNNIVRLRRSR